MGKRKHTHEFSDQYGEGFRPQQEEHTNPLAKGSGGGGAAGKSRHSNVNINFERQVPKFLQPYAHMLGQQGGGAGDEDAPTVVGGPASEAARRAAAARDAEDDEEDEAAAEAEAVARALEETPELAAQLDANYLAKIEASKEKEAGNKAFAAKDWDTAIAHFTKCIELDPKEPVYFSNRSAALCNAGRFDAALDDARRVLRLKPGWVKGHARAAAALMGLQQYGEAREAYEAATKLEPDDQALAAALNRAIGLELQHMRDRKHVFKKARPAAAAGGSGSGSGKQQQRGGGGGAGSSRPDKPDAGAQQPAAGDKQKQKQKQKSKLSFAEDEEEDEA